MNRTKYNLKCLRFSKKNVIIILAFEIFKKCNIKIYNFNKQTNKLIFK